MSTLLILIIAVAAYVALTAADHGYAAWRDRSVARGKTVVINLRTGESLDGRLTEWRGDLAVLTDVTLVTADGTRHAMDGDAIVPRRGISFLQVYGT